MVVTQGLTITVSLFLLVLLLIGKMKGYKIEKEDILLSAGFVLLAFQIERKGFEWAFDHFISLFIALTVFDFIRTKIKRWEEEK